MAKVEEGRKAKISSPQGKWVGGRGLALLLLALVALLAVIGAGPWLRAKATASLAHRVAASASQATGHPCELQAVTVDIRGTVTVKGLRCGPALALDFGQARIRWRHSIASRRIEFEVTLDRVALDTLAVGHVPAGDRAHRDGAPGAWKTLLSRAGVLLAGRAWTLRLPYGENDTAVLSIGTLRLEAEAQLDPLLLAANVAAESVHWQHGHEELAIEEARGTASWAAENGLQLVDARLRGSGVDLALRNRGPRRMFVRGTLPLRAIAAFVRDFPAINALTFVAGWLQGDALDPSVDVFLKAENADWNELSGAALRLRFLRHGPRLDFRSAHLRHETGSVRANVALELGRPPRLMVDGVATVWKLEQALRLARMDIAIPGRTTLHGSVRGEGPLEPLGVRWEADVRSSWTRLASGRGPKLALSWNLAGDFGPAEGSLWAQAQWQGTTVAEANHEWGEEFNAGYANVALADLGRLVPYLDPVAQRLGLSGELGLLMRWGQRKGVSHAEVTARARELTVLQSTIREVDCRARRVAGAQWELQHCGARDGVGGSLAIRGTWDFDATGTRTLALEAEQLAAEILVGGISTWSGFSLPVSRGRLDAKVEYRRQGSGQRIMGRAEMRQFRLYREPVSWLRMELDVEDSQWRWLSVLSRRDGAENITLRARGNDGTILEATLEGEPVSLGGLVGLGPRGVRGQLVVRGRWSGPVARPQGQLQVRVGQLEIAGTALGDAEFGMTFEPRLWSGLGRGFGGRFAANVQVTPAGDYPFESSFSLNDFELEAGIAGKFRWQLEAAGTVRGFAVRPRIVGADLSVGQLALARGGYRLAASHPVRISYDGTAFRLDPFELTSGESRIRVSGQGKIPGRIAVDVQGTSDLALLELLGPPIVFANGPVEANVHAEIHARQWQATGTIFVRDGRLEIEGLPPISNLNLQGTVIDDGLQAVTLGGEVGGGMVTLDGMATRTQGVALKWKLADVAAAWMEDLEGRVSGEGTLGGTWQQLTLRGDIRVDSAVYDRNLALGDLLRWLQERLFAPRRVQQAFAVPLELDLKVYSPGHVFIDNNFARVELWLDLWIRGNLSRPLVGGRIGVLDGEVTAQGRTFTITAGTVEFRDPATRNPWLNLVAETRIPSPQGEYQVTVQVTGQADRPRVQFSADDPSLSQEDILSLIALGRPRSAPGQTGFSPAGAALALVPKREAEQRLQQWFAVDRFEVSAAQARGTGTVEPRVTIGKELSERFYASAWTSIGAQSRQAMQLEYRWTRRVSLLGTWESGTAEAAGAFGGDVKFRLELVRSPLSLFCP